MEYCIIAITPPPTFSIVCPYTWKWCVRTVVQNSIILWALQFPNIFGVCLLLCLLHSLSLSLSFSFSLSFRCHWERNGWYFCLFLLLDLDFAFGLIRSIAFASYWMRMRIVDVAAAVAVAVAVAAVFGFGLIRSIAFASYWMRMRKFDSLFASCSFYVDCWPSIRLFVVRSNITLLRGRTVFIVVIRRWMVLYIVQAYGIESSSSSCMCACVHVDVDVDVVVAIAVRVAFLFFGRIISRAHFFFIIFAESTTGFFFLAEAVKIVAGLECVVDDESRAALLMSLLHSSSFRSPSWSYHYYFRQCWKRKVTRNESSSESSLSSDDFETGTKWVHVVNDEEAS